MISYDWNNEKNSKLKKERGISFEDIVEAIDGGDLLDVLLHPNQDKYPNQHIYVVHTMGYVYLVPYVTDGNKLFLKTTIPSRKAKKIYLENRDV